jgi:nicotinamide-nucleotide amidase
MSVAIFTIGTEVTRGELVNTNANWLADRLTALGFHVTEHVSVEDDQARIVETLQRLAEQNSLVLATGGLGPTSDDITSACVAKAVGVPLERHKKSFEVIAEALRIRGYEFSDHQQKQADMPKGARVLPNAIGTAPGFAITFEGVDMYFMPGVPYEMKPMFETYVVPSIADQAERNCYQIRLQTFGLPEAEVAAALADIEALSPDIRMGYRVHFPETEVKVLAKARTLAEAEERANEVAQRVRECLGDVVYGEGEDTYSAFVGQRLKRKGLTLAVAESCTGGMIGHMLTDVPGSSEYLLLDAVTYSNLAKTKLLGVKAETLRDHGAVSAQTAAAMAEGARALVDASIGVSVTGIAGPQGHSPDKPVGTVWFGLSTRHGPTHTELHQLHGSRARIRARSAYLALRLVANAAG